MSETNQTKNEELEPYTTEELSNVIDHVNCGFITIKNLMEFISGIFDEESKKYLSELVKELDESIEAINDYV